MLQSRILPPLAFLLSAVFSPFIIVAFLIVLMSWAQAATVVQFLLWSGIALLFALIIPGLYVALEVRRGRITDYHIMVRAQRMRVFGLSFISLTLGALVLWALGAPAGFLVLAMIVLANALVAAIITHFWKVSIHSWVLGASVAATALLLDEPALWWLLLAAPFVVWARQYRTRHTWFQGIAGVLLAVLITVGFLKLILR